QWVQAPPGDSLQPEATGAGMEETKCLKPSGSGSRIGDRASVQAATRVNAEQASHGVVQVKSVIVRGALVNLQYSLRYPRSEPNRMTRPVSEHDQSHIRSPFMTAAPKSRLGRERLRKTRTILESGVSGHGLLRFVYLDPPGLIRSWKMTGFCLVLVKRLSSRRLHIDGETGRQRRSASTLDRDETEPCTGIALNHEPDPPATKYADPV